MIFCPKKSKLYSGFTLIELLVVIGILAIVFSIVTIAINAPKQYSQAQNIKRKSDINALLSAIGQYTADNKGKLPIDITTTTQNISTSGANLCQILVPGYIATLPVDPKINDGNPVNDCSTEYDTGYTVEKDFDNRVTVRAPMADLGEIIQLKR